MQIRHGGVMAGVLMATMAFAPLAEAKRAGGGGSKGMSRSTSSSQSYQQSRPATPATPPPAQQAAPQRSGPGVGTMVAAGVAGAAVGAMAANAMADDKPHQAQQSAEAADPTTTQQVAAEHAAAQPEKKEGLSSWIWLVLIAGAAFFAFRKFGAKKKLANANPYAPNNSGPSTGATNNPAFARTAAAPQASDNTNIFGQSVGGGAAATGAVFTQSGQQLPDGTEPAAFLRIARQRFNHIQSMNSANNIQEIRRYLTPDLYQSMHDDIMANQDQDVAEFSNLNAMVADSATENGQYVVSVRFTGTVSEDLNSLPQPFSELWHFVKPVGSTNDWLLAGIQQD